MSEKVKVTQEQFDWLERYELTQEQIDHYIDIQPYKKRPDSPIVDWPASKVAKALYIGYEVEPEFGVGDWVVRDDKESIGKIIKMYPDVIETDLGNGFYGRSKDYRHATESEIAAEKGRRSEVKLSEILHDLTIKEKQRLRQILNS